MLGMMCMVGMRVLHLGRLSAALRGVYMLMYGLPSNVDRHACVPKIGREGEGRERDRDTHTHTERERERERERGHMKELRRGVLCRPGGRLLSGVYGQLHGHSWREEVPPPVLQVPCVQPCLGPNQGKLTWPPVLQALHSNSRNSNDIHGRYHE
jgi:hypothetical protein